MTWEIFCKGNPEGLQEDGDTQAVFEGNPQKTSTKCESIPSRRRGTGKA